jgi:hypothetical protein
MGRKFSILYPGIDVREFFTLDNSQIIEGAIPEKSTPCLE